MDFGQNRFLTEDPAKLFQNGNFTKVPVMIGVTADEFIDITPREFTNLFLKVSTSSILQLFC